MQQKQEPDYYMLPDGRLVFTASYHLKRGYCCGSGCRHCPFEFANVKEPRRTQLLKEREQHDKTEQ